MAFILKRIGAVVIRNCSMSSKRIRKQGNVVAENFSLNFTTLPCENCFRVTTNENFHFFLSAVFCFHKNNSVSQFARQGNTFLASNTVYVTMLPRLSFFGRGRRGGEWNIIGFKIARKVPEGLPERLSLHVQRVCTRDQPNVQHFIKTLT